MPERPPSSPAGAHALAASYAHCRSVAGAAARNFYYALRLLPAAKRDALCALYAFMRRADDISDDPAPLEEKARLLAAWHMSLERALAGETSAHPALPAVADTVSRYAIPPRYLHDLVTGAEMDLRVTRYATFDELRKYCCCVAGAVGLSCAHVFGFRDPTALARAETLGIAFQLTNILRDVKEDAALGRVYLPQEDIYKFACGDLLARGVAGPAFVEMMRFEAARAWQHYREGIALLSMIEQDSRAALWVLARIYSGILAEIESCGYDVFTHPRAGLSAWQKTRIMLRARLGWWPNDDVLEERNHHRRRTGGVVRSPRAG